MEGHSSIVAMLTKTLADVRPRSWLIDGEAKIVDGIIEAWFTFETGVARGRGHLRLRNAAGRC
jgi:putative flavoprotein involved in K+ transport